MARRVKRSVTIKTDRFFELNPLLELAERIVNLDRLSPPTEDGQAFEVPELQWIRLVQLAHDGLVWPMSGPTTARPSINGKGGGQ